MWLQPSAQPVAMSEVFLSYAREDRDIVPGSTFEDVIEEAILAAKVVVVVWTRASIKSEWVQAEASDGLERGILFPILLDDVRVPGGFRRKQSGNLVGWPLRVDPSEMERMLTALVARAGLSATKITLPPTTSWWYRPKVSTVTGILIASVLVSGLFLMREPETPQPDLPVLTSPIASIAVFPFGNAADVPAEAPFGVLAFEVGALLSRAGTLQVSSEDRVQGYLDSPLDRPGSRINTTHQLTGSLRRDGPGKTILSAQLLQTDMTAPAWQHEYVLIESELVNTVTAIADDVASSLNVQLPLQQGDVQRDAYLNYLQANAELRKPGSIDVLVVRGRSKVPE